MGDGWGGTTTSLDCDDINLFEVDGKFWVGVTFCLLTHLLVCLVLLGVL